MQQAQAKGMTRKEIVEAIAENERRLPFYVDVESIALYVNGCTAWEVTTFFEGCGDRHVLEHVRLLGLLRAIDRNDADEPTLEVVFH